MLMHTTQYNIYNSSYAKDTHTNTTAHTEPLIHLLVKNAQEIYTK